MTSSNWDVELFGEEEPESLECIVVKTERQLPRRVQLPHYDEKPVLVQEQNSDELEVTFDGYANYQNAYSNNSPVTHEPSLEVIGMQNGYPLYPTLEPWGTNKYFKYDSLGQLAAEVRFDSHSLYEYLYNHPLKSKLTIWIQRHPIRAPLIYRTNYGPTCRAKVCRPPKGPPNAIAVGHYRIAIDELTGRFPTHKADTHLHAAFFHISCFEEMVDLAAISREFNVLCENRPYVNAPHGRQELDKNRMLLEERRIPQAISKWLERAQLDPTWTATGPYDTLNYVAFTEKFGLRPHRKKCTTVPGLEHLDIAHLGAPRPVPENSVWGGRRVKGVSVADLCALEGLPNPAISAQKRKRERADAEDDDRPKSQRPRYAPSTEGNNKQNPIVLESRAPSPTRPVVRRSRPVLKHRARGPYASQPPYFIPQPTQPDRPPRAESELDGRQSQVFTGLTQPNGTLPANLLSAASLAPGTIIRTSGGEYIRNPLTGILEPVFSITMPESQQPAPTMLPMGLTNLDPEQPAIMPSMWQADPNYAIDPALLTAENNFPLDYVQASSPSFVYDGGIDYSDPVYSMYSVPLQAFSEAPAGDGSDPLYLETSASQVGTQETYFEGDWTIEGGQYYNTLTYENIQPPTHDYSYSVETNQVPVSEDYNQLFKDTMYSMGYDADSAEWFPGQE